ncbi:MULTISPECIES: adenylate/guanylate cyclase domain-containing protein [unclassified Mesorhizobium]|uniref:adenylate/guanylate cyclase domain-containing protein n=1 Tax=unclassified Mesorhizobium TaxID=325217 RepID=UPI000BB0241C|nr:MULTISPECIES: adenylate/guanylate cyclase domain-containing protein [unclassified Mesorhizobium]PBB23415.1 adenylate/guanylate cyclase domain-containing protein [Mesorhizobium sp. WSM4304]PBB72262.1 adenylate/guanylate cyclase domain-containing protein [Mesorhizobium sp. WSM4308]
MERRLTAILAADVVGYSRLMGVDEVGTLAALNAHRKEFLDGSIAEHRGRVVKLMGDGMLVEFPSVVNAVACSAAIQRGMASRNEGEPGDRRIDFRIGINLGDVIVEDDDIFGDGVNVAARLESMAEPGGIVVSSSVRHEVGDRLGLAFEDLGERKLKNIKHPVRVFQVRLEGSLRIEPRALASQRDQASVAVLPFQNMSGDAEQEYFADGVVEDIVTALAHFRHLLVIARNSSFAYKGRAVDVKKVGRELGVRYVVEGSVRRSGERLRISAQLIDSSTGAHLWADRFDGALAEVFDLQDQITSSIVGAIAPKMEQAEIERARRKPTESLEAYDYYLRGLATFDRTITKAAGEEALRLFNQAIARDPEFALAHARAARCYSTRKSNGWMVDRTQEVEEALGFASRAIDLGRDDAIALSFGGYVLGYVGGDIEEAAARLDEALALNPNLALAWGYSSWVKTCLGQPDKGIEHAARAMRLSPLDLRIYSWQFCTALAHFCAGHYDDALLWAERALRQQPNYASALRVAAASHALAGRSGQAKETIERHAKVAPALRLVNIADVLPPFRRPEDRKKYVEALKMAGMPH